MNNLIPMESIENKIYLIRGQKVMLDRDLAGLYRVKTFVLNQAVKRNLKRFPRDFMFQLTKKELMRLRSQFVILENSKDIMKKRKKQSKRGKHTKYLPYVFTEQGVAMLSSVLRSERAVQVNITIMRTFIKLRTILSTHRKLAQKLAQLEQKYKGHDVDIQLIFKVIRELTAPPEKPMKRIGFRVGEED